MLTYIIHSYPESNLEIFAVIRYEKIRLEWLYKTPSFSGQRSELTVEDYIWATISVTAKECSSSEENQLHFGCSVDVT